MDQVSFNLPTSNIILLNGQAVLLQNGTISSQDVNNTEVIQDDLFNKDECTKQITNELESIQENTFDSGSFVIVKDAQKDDCNLIQLTVQEAADLGIQFTVDNPSKTNSIVEFPSNNNQNILFQKVNEKINESTNIVNYLTNENLNDIPCVNKSLNEYTLVPQYVNGQIAYAVQLTGPEQVRTTQNVSIPITTVPAIDVQTPETDINKFLSPVTLATVVNKPTKKVETDRNDSLQSYVPSPKIRILNKVKHRDIIKNNNQRKIIPTNKDKVLVNRPRKLAPQKLLLPPLTKQNVRSIEPDKTFQTNVVEVTDTINRSIPTSEQISASISQPTLKVVNEREEVTEINRGDNIKKSVPAPSSLADDDSTKKTADVQIITIPQGSQGNKKIVSVSGDSKSGKKLTPTQLMQIAAVLQKNRHKKPSNISNTSTLYDIGTSTRIICRVLYPEDFKQEVGKAPVVNNVRKRGRRHKKDQVEVEKEEKSEKGKSEKSSDRVLARTRSGRVTRPPRHMVEDYKRLKGDGNDSEESYTDYQSGTDENIENSPAVDLLPGLNIHQKRNFKSQFRCPTCNKIYLGRVRMALHFTKYPDHCDSKQLELLKESAAANEDFESGIGESTKATWKKGLVTKGKGKAQRKLLGRLALDKVLDSYSENEVMHTCGRRVANMLTIWEMLLLRLESNDHDGKCKVQALLDELGSLVNSVRAVSQQILRQPNCNDPDINLEDDTLSTIFGMEKGWYNSDDGSLPHPLTKEQNISKQTQQRNSDDDCSPSSITTLSHLDSCKDEQDIVVKVKEELSELDLLCVQDDPVGVDSVDQIVSERLKTMAPVDELVSSLPVMAPTSADELVSGLLTDDLINSLETFIPPSHPPPDLDFTVLSNEFNATR